MGPISPWTIVLLMMFAVRFTVAQDTTAAAAAATAAATTAATADMPGKMHRQHLLGFGFFSSNFALLFKNMFFKLNVSVLFKYFCFVFSVDTTVLPTRLLTTQGENELVKSID